MKVFIFTSILHSASTICLDKRLSTDPVTSPGVIRAQLKLLARFDICYVFCLFMDYFRSNDELF